VGPSTRRFCLAVVALVFLLGLAQVTRRVASLVHPALNFDVGPSTGRYLDGFTESEERLPVTFRWTRERAIVSLPLEGMGDRALLKLRFARFLPGSAHLRLFVNGVLEASFSARSGRFRTLELPLSGLSSASRSAASTTTLGFLVDDPTPERLGIAVDWMRIENARWRLPYSSLGPALLVAGVFALTLALGFSLTAAVGFGSLTATAQAAWFALAPFAMAHVHREIVASALLSTGVVALALRRGPAVRWIPLLFLLGFVLKGAALFDPSYFYPDVRLHRRHLEVLSTAEGSLVEKSIAAQKASGTAYPRRLAGRDYAFPYSPVFYVPFLALDRDARGIESAMKHTGLVLAALELPLVFVLARYLLGARVALWAAILTPFLPPMTSRLLFAQWPTLAGHLLDVVAIFFAAHVLREPRARRPFLLYGLSGFASCLTYVSSLINLSLVTVFLALFGRRRIPALWLLSMWTAIGLATVLLLYFPFVTSLFTEILPALAEGGGESASSPGVGVGALSALGRIHLFYGVGFPAFAVAGFLLARRRPEAFRTLVVYGATFLALVALRAASGTFKDLKELVFVGPFVAITAGSSLSTLAARGRAGKIAAVAITVGLTGFGLGKIAEYAALHTTLAGLS